MGSEVLELTKEVPADKDHLKTCSCDFENHSITKLIKAEINQNTDSRSVALQ
jgi:hypothetical protein